MPMPSKKRSKSRQYLRRKIAVFLSKSVLKSGNFAPQVFEYYARIFPLCLAAAQQRKLTSRNKKNHAEAWFFFEPTKLNYIE
jgi:hypothetical protein